MRVAAVWDVCLSVCVCTVCVYVYRVVGGAPERERRGCVACVPVTSVCVRLVPGLCDVCDVSCVWTRCVDRDCVCDRICVCDRHNYRYNSVVYQIVYGKHGTRHGTADRAHAHARETREVQPIHTNRCVNTCPRVGECWLLYHSPHPLGAAGSNNFSS